MAPKKMTITEAIAVKEDLESEVKKLLNEFSIKTGLVLDKISVEPNKEIMAEIHEGQLTFLDDTPVYLRVDIAGRI